MNRSMATKTTRGIKKIEKPKPLKIPLKHSTSEISVPLHSMEDTLILLDAVTVAILRKSINDEILYCTTTLITKMKIFGPKLEESYKDHLDKAFNCFRNGSKDETLDLSIRINLLQLIELRAMQWTLCQSVNAYYLTKCLIPEPLESPDVPAISNNNTILGPGEIVKSSGKYSSPTKVPGKNYFKDEVVIRNADSGKVMGIKGRRVHMIEELSETVISFQRVHPGAKERNVQITGPEEEKIVLARQLIEDTIKRNVSPVKELEKDVGSNSSLNSTASEDSSQLLANCAGKSLLPNINKDESFEYKHSVNVAGKTIKLSSHDHDWLKWAKLVLDTAVEKTDKNVTFCTKQTQTYDSVSEKAPILLSPSTENLPKQSAIFDNNNESASEEKIETTHAEVKESEKNVLPKRMSVVRVTQYTRDFLLDLSNCSASCKPPPGWEKICAENPNIVKPIDFTQRNCNESPYFDPVLYAKKSLENETKIPSVVDDNLVCSDSD